MSTLAASSVWRTLTLSDYNTRLVLMGAVLLGISASLIGTFLFLRKRSLIGDVVGHSALPGIVAAFMLIELISPGGGKNVSGLLAGAALAGLLGAQSVALVRRFTRVQNDAALAVVLSTFYGAGVVLLSLVQRLPTGSSAGLKDYLNGRTATLLAQDVTVFAIASLLILGVTIAFFKELTLLCFDGDYAATAGISVAWLDTVLTCLATAVAVIGMQTVGLLLVTAILVIPPAAARFWTDDVRMLALISAIVGGVSAAIGVLASALAPRLAAGPMIVLAAGLFFVVSLTLGSHRGVLWSWILHRRDSARADRLDLLRAIYESVEASGAVGGVRRDPDANAVRFVISTGQLAPFRTWPEKRLERTLRRAADDGLLRFSKPGEFGVTGLAWDEACRVARNHRLWELYLIRYADVAPGSVDRSADLIEHVLDPSLIDELESALRDEAAAVPVNPHAG